MSATADRLRDAVLVHCDRSEFSDALAVLDRPNTGLVVARPRAREIRALAHAADDHGVVLLTDAERYAGIKNRTAAGERFDTDWIARQRDAGLPVLTDSGYIGEGNIAGLRSTLHQAKSIGGCIATLPLHTSWLDPRGGLDCLVDHVAAAGAPIAVVLEHANDPYSVRATLQGMLTLLTVGVPVIQLRSDVSGLGVLCHGAAAAAIGTRTKLRHLAPAKPGGGGGRTPSVATIVRDLLAYVSVDRIATAFANDPDDSLWNACECPSCNGRTLDTFARLPSPEKSQRAFGHAVHVALDLRDHLLHDADPTTRQLSWRAHCDSALVRYLDLRARGESWTAPRALRHWYNAPVPSRTG